MLRIGITDHLEGPSNQASSVIIEEVAELIRFADQLGADYAWFAEHHAHAHQGHMPTPLMLALHLAGQTERIKLGTAIICSDLHHPIEMAEQVAVADLLTNGRMAVGFGSGCTPEELSLYGIEADEQQRHVRFEQTLREIIEAWNNPRLLPAAAHNLPARCWIAANSVGAARIAGALNFNLLFSHLRTIDEYRQLKEAYLASGGTRLIAANRPIFVGEDDESAGVEIEPALRLLWRRFQNEGKIAADDREPNSVAELCRHPINIIVGGPATVGAQIRALRRQFPFDVLNVELRWQELSPSSTRDSLRRLMTDVMPHFLDH